MPKCANKILEIRFCLSPAEKENTRQIKAWVIPGIWGKELQPGEDEEDGVTVHTRPKGPSTSVCSVKKAVSRIQSEA